MTHVVLDPEGRLIRLAVVPPQLDPGWRPQAANWKPLFDAAGLDLAAFTPAAPEWTPTVYADTRVAWTGALPGIHGQQLRIEGGWTAASRCTSTRSRRGRRRAACRAPLPSGGA